MLIKNINVFKAGTGSVLKAGDPVLVHFAIASSHADIEAEKSLESSYVGAAPLLARLGDESTVAGLVSGNLIGRRARCTLRLIVDFEGSPGLPEAVAVELWPDNIEPDQLPVERFELVKSFPARDTAPQTQTTNGQKGSDSLWLRRLVNTRLGVQSSGIVVRLSEADIVRLRALLTVPHGIRAPVMPVPLQGSEQYLLHHDLIQFINERYLWPNE